MPYFFILKMGGITSKHIENHQLFRGNRCFMFEDRP